MSKIVAAEMLKPGEIVLKDFSMPEIEDDAILMKVAAVGICGSDKHMYAGKMNLSWPLIPGHEFSGFIEKIGKNANNSMKIIECGPGKVLTSLTRRINKSIASACIDSPATLEAALQKNHRN